MSAVSSNFRGGVFMSAIVEPSAQAVKRRAGSRGWACAGVPRLDPLAHMDRGSATKRFGPVYDVTPSGVEFEIGRERSIGQESDFRAPSLKSSALGVVKQQATKAPALPLRRNGDVLDPQVIRSQDRLDEAGERAVNDQKINRVLGARALIVCLHRHGPPPDQRHPLGIGRAREIANSRGVRGDRGPDVDIGSGRYHCVDYCRTWSVGKVARRLTGS